MYTVVLGFLASLSFTHRQRPNTNHHSGANSPSPRELPFTTQRARMQRCRSSCHEACHGACHDRSE
ncbi:hypothetical protein PR003_g15030 [Phytophthora rubi]|uniref:Uncharacterized protein n=1 Tax=Phytophthora rubi TaxID=129364 RepID=A0A6A3LR71_9STRA|nr:hypothetical protein PR002_g14475 [Phytophthora rubi]KAE9018283.1 hypothetical protein PR001_g14177 [Phytophthora rubi]KAE9331387.1 hypothetical protein PR003_g15030 [Phytophthora rubi]